MGFFEAIITCVDQMDSCRTECHRHDSHGAVKSVRGGGCSNGRSKSYQGKAMHVTKETERPGTRKEQPGVRRDVICGV